MYHFALILLGNIASPLTKAINEKLHLSQDNFFFRAFQMIRTSVLVVIGELFFRANGLKAGLSMFAIMFKNIKFFPLNKETLSPLGVDIQDLAIVLVVVLIVFVVGVLREKGIDVQKNVCEKSVAVRWVVLLALIMFIVIFGAYGPGYIPVDPMYAEF